jgi:hypothetical protein
MEHRAGPGQGDPGGRGEGIPTGEECMNDGSDEACGGRDRGGARQRPTGRHVKASNTIPPPE